MYENDKDIIESECEHCSWQSRCCGQCCGNYNEIEKD